MRFMHLGERSNLLNRRQRIIQKYQGVCQMCGINTDVSVYEKAPELDHIIPRSDGGRNEESNLSLLCNSCNNKRSNLYGERLIKSISSAYMKCLNASIFQSLEYEMKNKTVTSEMLEGLEIDILNWTNAFISKLRELESKVKQNG